LTSEPEKFELLTYEIRVKLIDPSGVKTNFIKVSGEWAHHDAYEPALTNFKKMADGMDARLPGPEPIAKVIYKAAPSNSGLPRFSDGVILVRLTLQLTRSSSSD
jgi:hypothetical protein